MIKIFTASVVFAAALVVVLPAADTAREQKLQQGIDLMESKGDLAKATPLFEEAARSSDRAVAARALLYLGQAQERRQGTDKARATYERIIKEFGNQTETAAAAQQRLAALGGVRASGTLAKRRLCADCGDNEADFSPDGHLMLFTDWDSGDLAIRNLSTGQVNRLLAKAGSWDSDDAFGETPVFSPDLRQIAYYWEVGNKEDDHQLRVMQNEPRGKPRVLISRREGATTYCNPTAWFPDGKSLLAIQALKDGTYQIARVSVSDGPLKVLKSLEWRLYRTGANPKLSPDGQYIVYSALAVNPSKKPPAPTDPKDQHIYVLAADGSSETEIVKTAGINSNPDWTPDGQHILFTSDRSGTLDLWSVAMQNGKAVGSASLVSGGIGGEIEVLGMHGSSYYYVHKETGVAYVTVMEAPRNDNSRPLRPLDTFVGVNPTWSPDGKSIAFKRHLPGSSDRYYLVIHSLETGDERTYLTGLDNTGGGSPGWFPDGKSIGTGVRRGEAANVLYRIDLKGGELTKISDKFGMLSPDEKTQYTAVGNKIVAVDLSSGQQKELFTAQASGSVPDLQLSPDGRTLVFRQPDQKNKAVHFARLNIDGTGYREIYSAAQKDEGGNWTLSHDGRWLLFQAPHGDKKRIMRISIDGGSPESTGFEVPESVKRFDLSPDSSRIAFGPEGTVRELWALDNVLPALK